MKCNLLNKVIETDHRTYEVKKYITFKDGRTDYYVSGFELVGTPERGSIWTLGRFKGDKRREPLHVGRVSSILNTIIVPAWYVADLKRTAKTNRFVSSSDGYVHLPDFLRFEHPLVIGEYAFSQIGEGNVHAEKPTPETWPPFELPENFRMVEVGS